MNDSIKNDVAMREMPKYKCKKQVWALKIKDLKQSESCENCESDGSYTMIPEEDGFAPIKLSWQFMNKHKPEVGGYYVIYKDGYKSFSPAKAFEEGYDKLNMNEKIECDDVIERPSYCAQQLYFYIKARVEYSDNDGDLLLEDYEFIATSNRRLKYIDIIKLVIKKFREDGYDEIILNINTEWYETDGLAVL